MPPMVARERRAKLNCCLRRVTILGSQYAASVLYGSWHGFLGRGQGRRRRRSRRTTQDAICKLARCYRARCVAGFARRGGARFGATWRYAAIHYRIPVPDAEKILCIGVNYRDRNAEYKDGSEAAQYPSMFFRTRESLVGHGEPILRPHESIQLDYEGEIALVIGKAGPAHPEERSKQAYLWPRLLPGRHDPRLDAARQIQRDPGQKFRRQRIDGTVARDRRRDPRL